MLALATSGGDWTYACQSRLYTADLLWLWVLGRLVFRHKVSDGMRALALVFYMRKSLPPSFLSCGRMDLVSVFGSSLCF
jgi:hypothetical protein